MNARTFRLFLVLCVLAPAFGLAQPIIKVTVPGQNTFPLYLVNQEEMQKDKNGENVMNGGGTVAMIKKTVVTDSLLFSAMRNKTYTSVLVQFYEESHTDKSLKLYGTMTLSAARIISITCPPDMQLKKDERIAVIMVKYKSVSVQQIK